MTDPPDHSINEVRRLVKGLHERVDKVMEGEPALRELQNYIVQRTKEIESILASIEDRK